MTSKCKRGHERAPENLTNHGACRTCVRDRQREVRLADPEKHNATTRAWRKNNPEKQKAIEARRHAKNRLDPDFKDRKRLAEINRVYGLELAAVPDTCQVCGISGNDRRICVDHDHVTGSVRGFLCTNCNSALGMAEDSIDRLKELISYLEIF